MKNIKNQFFALVLAAVVLSLNACQQAGGNVTGSEFVPDMSTSVAYEANVYNYYNLNTWEVEHGSTKSLKELSNPRKPVSGTIPRGQAAVATSGKSFGSAAEAVKHTLKVAGNNGGIPMTQNGWTPYYYEDTDSSRVKATNEIIYNPYPITENGLVRGKELYDIYCGICHGEKGDGNGWLVDEKNKNAIYPAAPANFLLAPDFTTASNGRYYHAIMYGKNVMGGYADKLSYEERWQVIHHIRALQAKEAKVDYNANVNGLNPDFGVPVASIDATALNELQEMVSPEIQGEDVNSEDAAIPAVEQDIEGEEGNDEGH